MVRNLFAITWEVRHRFQPVAEAIHLYTKKNSKKLLHLRVVLHLCNYRLSKECYHQSRLEQERAETECVTFPRRNV